MLCEASLLSELTSLLSFAHGPNGALWILCDTLMKPDSWANFSVTSPGQGTLPIFSAAANSSSDQSWIGEPFLKVSSSEYQW